MKTSAIALLAIAALVLAACSGGSPTQSVTRAAAPSVQFATGPIYSACRQAGRDAASRQRCGCVQAVANQSLGDGDQIKGAGFFSDPHRAQEVRTSDRASDEAFWTRWRDFGDAAARQCT